jgi:uncharacterized integral membrane protein
VKHFSWILTFPLTVVIIVFAVANRRFVPVDLWPFEAAVEVPVFALGLGGMLIGFLAGAVVMWLSGRKQRRQARTARSRIAELERQVRRHERETLRPESQAAAVATRPPPAAAQDRGPRLPAA